MNKPCICSWCCSVMDPVTGETTKLTQQEYVRSTFDENQSHGVCKACASKMRAECEQIKKVYQ